MIYTFFSDIHASLPALQRAVEEIEGQLVVLGDAVGYGASPKECVDILRTLNPVKVIGNHDDYCVGNRILGVTPEIEAKKVLEWTKNQLGTEDLEFLAGEADGSMDDFAFTHILHAPAEDYFFQTRKMPQLKDHRILFVGHTHKPYICEIDQANRRIKMVKSPQTKFDLDANKKYIINVGSVGQPRDGDSRLCFVKYFPENNQVVFLRLEYDVKSAQEKILQERLPERFALRLSRGM